MRILRCPLGAQNVPFFEVFAVEKRAKSFESGRAGWGLARYEQDEQNACPAGCAALTLQQTSQLGQEHVRHEPKIKQP